MTAFYLLRHGQTDWNKAARLQGSTDIALNDTGRAQAARAGEVLKAFDIDTIIASPLSRAKETAEIVAKTLNSKVLIDDRLTERHFGAFEGMTLEDVLHHRSTMSPIMSKDPDLDGKHYPVNAETLQSVIDRVKSVLNERLTAENRVLFVSHGIPFRAITRLYTGQMMTSPNAAPVRIEPETQGYRLIALDPDNYPVPVSEFQGPTTMGRF